MANDERLLHSELVDMVLSDEIEAVAKLNKFKQLIVGIHDSKEVQQIPSKAVKNGGLGSKEEEGGMEEAEESEEGEFSLEIKEGSSTGFSQLLDDYGGYRGHRSSAESTKEDR